MNDKRTRVTGKQVLLDAVTLAKDAGSLIFELSKRAFTAVKNALKSKDKNEDEERRTVIQPAVRPPEART